MWKLKEKNDLINSEKRTGCKIECSAINLVEIFCEQQNAFLMTQIIIKKNIYKKILAKFVNIK